MRQYSANITVMMKAAEKAAKGLIRDFGEIEKLQVSQKGPKDFVSTADTKAEKTILKELTEARPGYGILSEESAEVKGDGEHRWIIDPLDGTMNFLHGVPMFCTTIALEKKLPSGRREIIAAVTSAPILKCTFWAEKGQGAWLERWDHSGSERLRVAARKKLSDALLGVGHLEDALNISGEMVGTRCLGSTALALAYVASGNLDCFIQKGAAAWDVAAGILLINEAGGYCSDEQGRDKMIENRTIVAANEDLHVKLLRRIAGKG